MLKDIELSYKDSKGIPRIIHISDRKIELWGRKIYKGKFNIKNFKIIRDVDQIVWIEEPNQEDKHFLKRMLNLLPFT